MIPISFVPHRAGRGLRRLALAALALLSLALPALSQEYRLGFGDRLRMVVAGMPGLGREAQVDGAGEVRLIPFDALPAAGRTLAELEAVLRDMAAETVFRSLGPDGTMTYLEVAGADLFLEIAEYRPVLVTGSVVDPGAVAFRPGLTLRAAIAAAGGVLRPEAVAMGAGGSVLARQLADLERMRHRRAELIAGIWSAETLLGRDSALPTPERLGLTPEAATALLDAHRAIQQGLAERGEAASGIYLTLAEQMERRSALLTRQQEAQEQSLAADTELLARIEDLRNRGLVPVDRLADIRRAQTLSNSQLLDTGNELQRLEAERTRIEAEQQREMSAREEALLTDLLRFGSELLALEAEISWMTYGLGLGGGAALAAQEGGGNDLVEVLVHRGSGTAAETLSPDMGSLVESGDLVEVRLGSGAQ